MFPAQICRPVHLYVNRQRIVLCAKQVQIAHENDANKKQLGLLM